MRADPWCPTLSQSNWTENFDSLADLIASYPQITRETHFVFVPGPLDITGSSALPRRPILSAFTTNLRNKIPKVYFTSNPCRLKFFGQEIVIFREDTMARMLRNQLALSRMSLAKIWDDMYVWKVHSLRQRHWCWAQLVQSILDQSHLIPLTTHIQPVLPDFDHAFRLYPLPTAVSSYLVATTPKHKALLGDSGR